MPALPPSLEGLFVSQNKLTSLPALPSSLKAAVISNNQLTGLPELPSALCLLDVSRNQLTSLPKLPPSLQLLVATSNQLTTLPTLPNSLQKLDVSNNQLTSLPESIYPLFSSAKIRIKNNPFSIETAERLFQFFKNPIIKNVSTWFPAEQQTGITKKWIAIAEEPNAAEFSNFLRRLHTIENSKQTGFKEQIAAWLVRLSDSPALRQATFQVAMDATTSCDDRVTLSWNNMQKAELLYNAESGIYDQQLTKLVSVAREMFRLEQLELIARKKEKDLINNRLKEIEAIKKNKDISSSEKDQRIKNVKKIDPIEVYLAFQTELHKQLKLTSTASAMTFFGLANVTEDDLQQTQKEVQKSENEQFASWFAQWQPWHQVMARIAPESWESITDKRYESLENDFDHRVEEKLADKGLAGDADAKRAAGVEVMQEIDREIFAAITQQILAGKKQDNLLTNIWQIDSSDSNSKEM